VLKSGRHIENSTDVKKLRKLVNASNLPMKVIAEIKTNLKLGGVEWPSKFWVVEKLGHDVIIGTDLLKATQAVIDKQDFFIRRNDEDSNVFRR
jgi:hypothetical protein